MDNFKQALDIIKNKYNGEYSGRGSWDMVIFKGEKAKERCVECHKEVQGLLITRPPAIPSETASYNPYFQCRG